MSFTIFGRLSPGPCLVCGKPHTSCVPPGYRPPVHITQLPHRDRQARTGAAAATTTTTADADSAPTPRRRWRKREPVA